MISLHELKKRTYLLALVPFLALILLYELYPLLMVLWRSFQPTGETGFTLAQYQTIFTKKLYQQAIVNSVIISTGSALVGILVAFFGARAAYATGGLPKRLFLSVLSMTSNFAGVPLAFAYIILLGSTGVMVTIGKEMNLAALAEFDLYTVSGLLLIYIYFQIPLAILLLVPAFDVIRKEWVESVSLLGGSTGYFWLKVGIPVLMPSLLGTFGVLFANAIAAYATAYALLQNNFSLLPIRIEEQFVGDIVQKPELGSALAVVMMLLMVLSILINNAMLKRAGGRPADEQE